MSLHDAYARLTPYEVAFPDRDALGALRAAVADEAPGRGLDATELDGFLRLEAVAAFLEKLRAEESDPETLLPFAALLFHAVRFDEGRALYLMSTDCVRELVSTAPSGVPRPPAPAGYLQLPQHLVWVTGSDGARPESLDGVFWSVSAAGQLHVLLATGLRPERPGFGAVPLAPAPLSDSAAWLRAQARAEGADFQASLPGAELDALIQVETAGEVLKLLARFFLLLSSPAGSGARAVLPTGEDSAAGPAETGAPRSSALPYTRVAATR